MKKLLRHLRPYLKESVLGPLFKLLEASLDLIVPLVIAAIIDYGVAPGDSGYIINMCLLLVGLGIIGLGFSVTAQYFAAKAAVGFVTRIRRALFKHIGTLSYTELDRLGASTLITRMTSDVNQVQSGTNLALRLLLRSPFVVFGAMIMAFTIDFDSAMIFVAAIAALSAVVFGIMLGCIPLYKKVQSKLDGVTGATRENLTGVRVLRAFRRENDEIRGFADKNESLTSMQKHVGRISALMNPLTYVIINLAIIWLIQTGAVEVGAGILTQGAVVALYNYMSQILVELIKLANLIISITKAVASGKRIQSVLDMRSTMTAPEKSVGACSSDAPAVEFRNVSLKYSGAGGDSITGLDLSVARGETVGVIGGTGSGKSTLVNLIPRFYDATDGAVLVNGRDVRDYSLDELRGSIGVVPQKATLFHGTIRDNISWGRRGATDDEIMAALDVAQAREIAEKKPGGLDYELEQGGRNLSGGQKQRFTIARALVKKPEILILDDSASALDFATDAALRRSIRAMGGVTVFIVSQRAASVRYADKIVALDDGRVAGIGTHDELMSSCDVYREIYESQFGREEA